MKGLELEAVNSYLSSIPIIKKLVIAIIVAFVVVIHLQCLVSVYLSLVKIKYSVCVWKKKALIT